MDKLVCLHCCDPFQQGATNEAIRAALDEMSPEPVDDRSQSDYLGRLSKAAALMKSDNPVEYFQVAEQRAELGPERGPGEPWEPAQHDLNSALVRRADVQPCPA